MHCVCQDEYSRIFSSYLSSTYHFSVLQNISLYESHPVVLHNTLYSRRVNFLMVRFRSKMFRERTPHICQAPPAASLQNHAMLGHLTTGLAKLCHSLHHSIFKAYFSLCNYTNMYRKSLRLHGNFCVPTTFPLIVLDLIDALCLIQL